MKRQIIIFGIFSILIVFAQPAMADRQGFVRTVVIDPGHGGRDPGALGAQSKEKDIVLAIALKLGGYIESNFDDVKVIYTRTTDEFVELHRRAQIANENKADLFISIHCNSAANRRAFGAETFVMGLHRSQENLEVARKENAAILYEDNYLETYGGYDPNSPEANIIFSMYQNIYLNQSLTMASLLQDQFRDRAGRHDRGVKQAGFLILYNITMPGILVEAGFLSNPQEEKYLMSEMGQAHIASAIFRAFRDYKNYQDNLVAQQLENNGSIYAKSARHGSGVSISEDNTGLASKTKDGPIISFRVQFATTSQERAVDDPVFKDLQGVGFYFHEGLYKYTLGNESTVESAGQIQQKLHARGFNDAFIVAFKDNERIPLADAIKLIEQQAHNP
ncbi:MAG: N-acetylmuramoyl-L-alanine amidase [Bacteroidetes bacterium]|nr:MAG: N-acetylmuramoyl-L-alanine amidase [Bacteroidota bacterium]